MAKEKGVNMIAAVSKALAFRKNNPRADSEMIMKHVSRFIEATEDDGAKLGMIAASSRAVYILEREPNLTDKEIIKRVMKELPEIKSRIDEE